jgi:metal-sulfur cluster biosynthetic enzyme
MGEPAESVCAGDILQALTTVIDPELGLSIVELGMVRTAAWRNEDVDVAITPTSPSCPLTQLLMRDAEDALRRCFPDAGSIRIELVWSPPWSFDRLSNAARERLGLPPDELS